MNEPMIRHWAEAIGDTNPRWHRLRSAAGDGPGVDDARAARTARRRTAVDTMVVLDAAGYTSVLGTNCDQTYARYLRAGEQVR